MSYELEAGHPLATLFTQAFGEVLGDWNVQFGTTFELVPAPAGGGAVPSDVPQWVWVQLGICGQVWSPFHIVFDARVLRSAVESLGFVDLPEDDFGAEGIDAVRELANLMAGSFSRAFSAALEGLRVTQRQSDIAVDVLSPTDLEQRVAILADCSRADHALSCAAGGPWRFFAALPCSAVADLAGRLPGRLAA